MKTLALILPLIFSILISCSGNITEIKIGSLKCDYLSNPLAVESLQPQLSWKMHAVDENTYNIKQEAYQILVATSPENLTEEKADLWNSGKIKSDLISHIVYEGKNLKSQLQCYWKVAIWHRTPACCRAEEDR